MTRRKALAVTGLGASSSLDAVPQVKALAFDVFGTVVDWRSSIIREGKVLNQRKGLQVDWAQFADKWRAGYGPSMDRVRKGELPWTRIDDLHRMVLDKLLIEFRIEGFTEEEKQQLNRVWHRLNPWPDSVQGLTRLRRKYLLATLSNGNTALLANMAKFARLPWDVVLSAEMFKHYKPDREVYVMAADYLGVSPDQLLMVAAHKGDLQAARRAGLKTAYVPRPLEHGPNGRQEGPADPEFDLTARDFLDLAAQLGA